MYTNQIVEGGSSKIVNFLAGWVIFQLLVIGWAGAGILNDRINCVPEVVSNAYDDRFGYYFVSMTLPLIHFAEDTEVEVIGCPTPVTSTTTPSV
jgi:hypothetical protein